VLGLELVVAIGGVILVGGLAAKRWNLAPPIPLVALGVLLGFIPALRTVQLPPEAVLLLFLPALLYWESLTTSLREIRKNLRGIVLAATVLVIASAAASAATAHALGMPWGPAWVLGAALAPTDATAVGVVSRLLPRRNVTVLRAESLVNDGTALVVYGVAVGVVTGQEHVTLGHVTWLFIFSYVAGAASGVLVAWIGLHVRRRISEPLLGNTTTALIPFSAYLLAESLGASGVLAVVTAGLIMSQAGPRSGPADTRRQAEAFWSLSTFWLNGALFALVGLEMQSAVRGLTSEDLTRALETVALVALALIAVRITFLFAAAYAIRALDRRPQQLARRVSGRYRIVSGLAGFRGAVSLAVALSVPDTLDSGATFPQRDAIVFITAGVIVLTLLQGLALPGLIRWAHLPKDTSVTEERHLAETTITKAAHNALPRAAALLGTPPEIAEHLSDEYRQHVAVLDANHSGDGEDPALQRTRAYTDLRLALIAEKRAALIRLRDENHIDDVVLRQVQAVLDIEEVRLARTVMVE